MQTVSTRPFRLRFVILALIIFISNYTPSQLPAKNALTDVSFAGARYDISEFRQQRLGKEAIEDIQKSNSDVRGKLAVVPNSDAAVIILPGVNGLQASHLDWAQHLNELGYNALVIDHYGSRRARNFKDLASVPTIEDTLGAAQYLISNQYAAPNKIALLGFDQGASRTLAILSKNHPFAQTNKGFTAGVALYPNCSSDRVFSAPVMMLAGDRDHLMTIDTCKKLSKSSSSKGEQIELHLLKGATHFFDDPAYRKPLKTELEPLWFESNHYSENAHNKAKDLISEFLGKHLK
ncbi:dienelactone hydrolase family protein [Sneathiella glossodoripedis]|uniref:dienelactone hydrolase family protein n=1 Tax=Sneathiella glossodoripedis TaxID=418853 RepID=UPI0004727279|nr:dienelactone hydrolase family protein [Sneathiella glossodoripedis]